MLNAGGAGLLADLGHQLLPGVAVFAIDADLDQLVSRQGVIDFSQHRGAQPVARNTDHRIQMVGAGAKSTSLDGREVSHVVDPFAEKDAILLL